MSNLGFLSWSDNPKSRPDFSTMTDEELRIYVLANRQDTVAFHAYINRMQQRPRLLSLNRKNGVRSGCSRFLNKKAAFSDHENKK